MIVSAFVFALACVIRFVELFGCVRLCMLVIAFVFSSSEIGSITSKRLIFDVVKCSAPWHS